MAIRKIYTNGELELEVLWSKKGIHLQISHCRQGELPPTEFIIEKNDLFEFSNDIETYTEAINDSEEDN